VHYQLMFIAPIGSTTKFIGLIMLL